MQCLENESVENDVAVLSFKGPEYAMMLRCAGAWVTCAGKFVLNLYYVIT
jgi:hypothetical protein